MTAQSDQTAQEHWMQKRWRPAMGWMYMVVCVFDFIAAPVMWSILQAVTHGNVSAQWQPLTLQGAGLFHLAMGAVLGIAAFGRTQEKLGGNTVPQVSSFTTPSNSFSQPGRTTSFGTGFASPDPQTPMYGRRGPVQPEQPEI